MPGIQGDVAIFKQLLTPLLGRTLSDAAQDSVVGRWHAVRAVHCWPLPLRGSVDDLAAAMLKDFDGPLVLLGLSLGGLVAAAATQRAPSRVRALIGVNALPHPRHRPPLLRPAAKLVGWLPRGMVARAYRSHVRARHRAEGIPLDDSQALLQRLPSPAVLAARLEAVCAWRGGLLPQQVPTLWLRGDTDREAPWTLGDARRALPHAVVQGVTGGHRCVLTHSVPLLRTVDNFLASALPSVLD